jgi:hypothetical protein
VNLQIAWLFRPLGFYTPQFLHTTQSGSKHREPIAEEPVQIMPDSLRKELRVPVAAPDG